jgi:hypothetical protein
MISYWLTELADDQTQAAFGSVYPLRARRGSLTSELAAAMAP